jgi:hypothetical protein
MGLTTPPPTYSSNNMTAHIDARRGPAGTQSPAPQTRGVPSEAVPVLVENPRPTSPRFPAPMLRPPLGFDREAQPRGAPSRWNPTPRRYINLNASGNDYTRVNLGLAVPGWCVEWPNREVDGTTDTLWGKSYSKYRTLHQKQPTTWSAAYGRRGAFLTWLRRARATCFWWACAHVLSPQAFQTAVGRAGDLAAPGRWSRRCSTSRRQEGRPLSP